jgi:hypothetical protein
MFKFTVQFNNAIHVQEEYIASTANLSKKCAMLKGTAGPCRCKTSDSQRLFAKTAKINVRNESKISFMVNVMRQPDGS